MGSIIIGSPVPRVTFVLRETEHLDYLIAT